MLDSEHANAASQIRSVLASENPAKIARACRLIEVSEQIVTLK
jgi:hypothetical protein